MITFLRSTFTFTYESESEGRGYHLPNLPIKNGEEHYTGYVVFLMVKFIKFSLKIETLSV